MRRLFFLAALSMAFAVHAQPARDANPRDAQNTQGANSDANAMDPATKARVRVEGVPGGTGARVPPEASGGATVGQGDQHRHAPPKPPDPQQGENRSEKSSDRDEARGAQGAVR
jgi:hypothetical protein